MTGESSARGGGDEGPASSASASASRPNRNRNGRPTRSSGDAGGGSARDAGGVFARRGLFGVAGMARGGDSPAASARRARVAGDAAADAGPTGLAPDAYVA